MGKAIHYMAEDKIYDLIEEHQEVKRRLTKSKGHKSEPINAFILANIKQFKTFLLKEEDKIIEKLKGEIRG